jgi:hypothetical protein
VDREKTSAMDAEHRCLEETAPRQPNGRGGAYLSEQHWGTVREDYNNADDGSKPRFWLRALAWYVGEMKHVLPPTIFFFIGFNLMLWTKQMILKEHQIEFSGFLVATMAALVVGKAVLVTDHMAFMRRFEGAPLLQPIVFKAVIYSACVFLVRLGEELLHFLRGGGALVDFSRHLSDRFSWPHFLTVQVWLMVLFLVYVTVHELNRLFGDGELYRLFFRWRSSQARLTRRQRIRLLTRLSRLSEANTLEAFNDPRSRAHAELVEIIRVLSTPPPAVRTKPSGSTGDP